MSCLCYISSEIDACSCVGNQPDQKSSIVLFRSAFRCSFIPGGKIGSPLASVTYPAVGSLSVYAGMYSRKGISIDSCLPKLMVGKS